MEFNKEDYKAEPSKSLDSKYYRTWEQYKISNPDVSELGQSNLQDLEERMFQYIISLLI